MGVSSPRKAGGWTLHPGRAGETLTQLSETLLSLSSLSWWVSLFPGSSHTLNLLNIKNPLWVKSLVGLSPFNCELCACVDSQPWSLLSFRKSYEHEGFKDESLESSWHCPNSAPFEVGGALLLVLLEARSSRHRAPSAPGAEKKGIEPPCQELGALIW